MNNNKKNLFLFWHQSEEQMPLFHRMSLNNIRRRLESSCWNVQLTNLDKSSPNYIENYIDLPSFFFELPNRMNDIKGLHGNQSDIIRLRLLEKFGGVYFDTSVILLQNDIFNIKLYKHFTESNSQLAGYTNVTFTRKNKNQSNYYQEAKDGIELGVLFAQKNSSILSIFNCEIERYWRWKTKNDIYSQYPPFLKYGLAKNSFLNEYHVHYAIFHLILAKYPELVNVISTQSMHMQGKEMAYADGPYSIQDRFCRGRSRYESASPERLLQALLPGIIDDYSGREYSFQERVKLFLKNDLLVFPGYLRREVEKYFKSEADYNDCLSAFTFFYYPCSDCTSCRH